MQSPNGKGLKQAILYTRVSGDRQRDYGYSLLDQKRELKEWAAKEGYEVVKEVEDGAWSGGLPRTTGARSGPGTGSGGRCGCCSSAIPRPHR
jgi:hypothetical protein